MTECSIENCSTKAEFLCKCLKTMPKFCESHISQHLKIEARHRPINLNLSSEKLNKIIKKAEKINSSLSDLEAALTLEKTEMIQKLSENYDICIQVLKNKQERLKNSLNPNTLDLKSRNYIQTISKFSEKDLKIELKSWKTPKFSTFFPKMRKIMSLGTVLNEDFPPYFQDFSSFMWINVNNNPGIYKFDFDDVVTVNRLKVLDKFLFVNTCQLNNELIFVSAGTADSNKEKNFLFNSRIGEMVKIRGFSSEARNLLGTVFTDFEVYLFGGCKNVHQKGGLKLEEMHVDELCCGMIWASSASKYNILTKEWKKLSDLPLASEISSISLQKVKSLNHQNPIPNSVSPQSLILLTGYKLIKIFQYSPFTDTYEETPSIFEDNKFKTLLTYQSSVYLLYNKTIKQQKTSNSNWKTIGYFTFLKDCHISHQAVRADCIIFTNNQQIWSFNTNSIEIKELHPYQTHYIFDSNTQSPHKKMKISDS